ncbi:PAS domain-containing protein [Candidatus Microgenomates bacterium]|nr:MAG: PAS domain-containing protein [Candidatus Microgenomates bacterium]
MEKNIFFIEENDLTQESYHLLNKKIVNILESITDAFFAIDQKWQFSYVNRQAEHLLQKTREELLGKKFWEELPEFGNSVFYKKTQQVVKSGVSANFEMFCLEFNKKWFEVRLYPSKDGLAIYFQDITQRKEIERRKDEFISIASHELKTPLTSAKAYIQILQKYAEKTQENISREYLGRVNEQLIKLTNIVNNVLDVSRIKAGNLTLNEELFNINDLIKELVKDFKTVEKKYKFVVKGKIKEVVLADKDRVSQVIINLISNAIKYSSKSKKIIISFFSDKENVIVSVKDFGMGISKENQEKIFDRFYRINESRRLPGLGLGLYISSEIVRYFGGKLWVKSAEKKGSTFYFTLPRVQKFFKGIIGQEEKIEDLKKYE